MSVKLELYRVFKEVAEAGNITAAAQALYISQSAVSQSIKQLEGELQTRLFARNSRGVALTPDGRMLYEYVRSAIGLLETGEESGSPDLPAYLEHLADRLGDVSLVVCLDSGAGDYERLWLTTALRGLVQLEVTVHVLDSGQHSGTASGIVPSSFRIMRQLLDRLEDSATGEILVPELNVAIPPNR